MHRVVREIFRLLSCAISRLDHIFDHLQNFSVRKQRKHWSNMARFSGIYGLYVNNCVQKTYKYLFGNWRPRVRVPPLRPKNSRKRAIFDLFSAVFYTFCTKMAILGWPHVCPNFEPLDCCFIAFFPLFQKIPFLCLLRLKFWRLTVAFRQPFVFVFSLIYWNLLFKTPND